MQAHAFGAVPRHIGIIPDGNRRWADAHGLPRHAGYQNGVEPGEKLIQACRELGVGELTFYGFTQDNTKRAVVQRKAFQKACVEAVHRLSKQDAEMLVVGNAASAMFPSELLQYTQRQRFGCGSIKVNLLVNYSWQWDLDQMLASRGAERLSVNERHLSCMGSADVSRIDMVIRWGGRRRLSGFLPIQTVYSDFYVLDDLWPDYDRAHLDQALAWYQVQDVTLGG